MRSVWKHVHSVIHSTLERRHSWRQVLSTSSMLVRKRQRHSRNNNKLLALQGVYYLMDTLFICTLGILGFFEELRSSIEICRNILSQLEIIIVDDEEHEMDCICPIHLSEGYEYLRESQFDSSFCILKLFYIGLEVILYWDDCRIDRCLRIYSTWFCIYIFHRLIVGTDICIYIF